MMSAARKHSQAKSNTKVPEVSHSRHLINCAIDLIRSRRHREDAHDPADLERGFAGDLARDPTPAPDRLAASASPPRSMASRRSSAPPSRCGTSRACRLWK
jgi:hypothetical protein